jgi:sigma-B regulation protein RsbU (phosphoserine phosphatase)
LRMQGSFSEVKLEMRRHDGKVIPVMVNVAEQQVQERTLSFIAVFAAEERHKYERELLAQRRHAEELSGRLADEERQLAQQRREAEQRAQAAEQMMGIVSHDLRNPLSVIHLSAVLMDKTGAGAHAVPLQRIHRSVQRAERLIGDLLDFTQARLGHGLQVRTAQVDAHRVVRDAVGELQSAFPERVIQFSCSGPGECLADAERLAQAVSNLVSNAVAYGRPGIAISVTSTREAQGLAVRVHNWGTPIPPDLVGKLFEPMVRGQAEGAARSVGLGLFIVHEIARAHGGSMHVASTLATGTAFTMRLPAGR